MPSGKESHQNRHTQSDRVFNEISVDVHVN